MRFTRATGHAHAHLEGAAVNYASLLNDMGRSPEDIVATLRRMVPELVP